MARKYKVGSTVRINAPGRELDGKTAVIYADARHLGFDRDWAATVDGVECGCIFDEDALEEIGNGT